MIYELYWTNFNSSRLYKLHKMAILLKFRYNLNLTKRKYYGPT